MIESFGTGNAAVRRHRPVGAQPGRQRLPGDRRALRRQPDPGPMEGGEPPARVRRRPGVHGLVVLRAEGPRHQLRARLHEPGGQPARPVRGRWPAAGADRRRTSRWPTTRTSPGSASRRSAGIPLPAIPEMSNVWGSLGLAEVNTLRGGDGPGRVHRRRRGDPLADRRLAMTDGGRGARTDPGAGPRTSARRRARAAAAAGRRLGGSSRSSSSAPPTPIAIAGLIDGHRPRGVGLRRRARRRRSSPSTSSTCRGASSR